MALSIKLASIFQQVLGTPHYIIVRITQTKQFRWAMPMKQCIYSFMSIPPLDMLYRSHHDQMTSFLTQLCRQNVRRANGFPPKGAEPTGNEF